MAGPCQRHPATGPRPVALATVHARTLARQIENVLAHFDRPGTSNGPAGVMNGRMKHLCGSALGFRNLTNYVARRLVQTGSFRPQLHPALR